MGPMESLRRGLGVLECFSNTCPELRLVDICLKTGLAPSTAHRVVTALVNAGYLQKSEPSKAYAIGLRAYTIGTIYLSYAHSLIEATRPVLDLLGALTQERVALHVLDHQYCVLIASRECPHPVRFTEPIGSRTLAHCSATGKALLSGLDLPQLLEVCPDERLERVTEATITDRVQLLGELQRIRATGVAFNSGENFPDMRGVAAPVRNGNGVVVASISVAGPSSRIDVETCDRVAGLVLRAGDWASNRLGYVSLGGNNYTSEEIRLWWEGMTTRGTEAVELQTAC